MKRLVQIMMLIAAAGCGLGLGFAWRANAPREPDAIPCTSPSLADNITSSSTAPRSSPTSAPAFSNKLALAEQLETDLSMSEGVTRWLYWLEAIERAQVSDFPGLARLAKHNPAALQIVAARWIQLDPHHLFHTLLATPDWNHEFPASQLSSELFKQWPKQNPEAAIAALTDAKAAPTLQSYRTLVAMSVIDQDPERGLELMSQWNLENFGPSMRSISRWAAANPRHSAEFTLETKAGYATQLALETIGKEWAKTDPAAAMEFAARNSNQLADVLAKAALKEWTASRLEEAGAWLASTDDRTRRRLSGAFLEVMAKEDLDGAVSWCVDNLSGSGLERAMSGVLTGAASTDVRQAARLVNELAPSSIRSEAAVAVGKAWFPQTPSSDQPVAPEAVAWLSALDPDAIQRVLDQVSWDWANIDPQSLAEFLLSAAGNQSSSRADTVLARGLARQSPLGAIEWAARLPRDRGLKAGGAAFVEWRQAQPQQAMDWLRNLPATDPRSEAFFRDAVTSLTYQPNAEAQLAALTPNDQASARSVIESLHIDPVRRAKFLEALASR